MGLMRSITRETAEAKKQKAARFVRSVLGDDERASQIEAESADDYAERKGFAISNPKRKTMATTTTKDDLQKQVDDLQEALGQIHEILSDAYTPEATREKLAKAIGEALELIDVEDEDEEDDEEEEDGDEE